MGSWQFPGLLCRYLAPIQVTKTARHKFKQGTGGERELDVADWGLENRVDLRQTLTEERRRTR